LYLVEINPKWGKILAPGDPWWPWCIGALLIVQISSQSRFRGIMLVAWNWSWWKELHYGCWQMLSITAFSPGDLVVGIHSSLAIWLSLLNPSFPITFLWFPLLSFVSSKVCFMPGFMYQSLGDVLSLTSLQTNNSH
jgi:hypothetical protein